MLKLVVIFALAAYVAGNEFCSQGDAYHSIYRVGLNTCPCTKENVGALRFHNDVLEVCNSKGAYVAIGSGNGGRKDEIGSKEMPASSCREILKANPEAKNGMFFLKKEGSVAEAAYCHMEELCGEKGWTMILKADGTKATFGYDSNVWTNQDIVSPAHAAGGLNEQETKLHTYHTFSFDRLCIGLKTGGSTRWQKLNYNADSLYSIIRGGVYHPTRIDRGAWKKLVPGSSLQRNCNKEGFNVRVSKDKRPASVRIGIIGNQENNCASPDSRIGIGGAGDYCGQDKTNSVGNTARCGGDNGNKNIKSFGYVFAADGMSAGSRNNPGASCKDIKLKNKHAESGVYYLKSGDHFVKTYCEMDKICGSSGWSMIMKLDGTKKTFSYDSNYWKNKAQYNTEAVSGGLDKQEMKLDSYHLLPFDNLCVGMREGNNAIRWLKIPKKASSLYSLIADGKYRGTNLGRNAWKRLLKHGSLQRHCNKEGFNPYHGGARARIGIISNQENNCNSPDSRIAFGGAGGHCGQNNNHSVGNEAKCFPDNWDRSTAAFGYILAQ